MRIRILYRGRRRHILQKLTLRILTRSVQILQIAIVTLLAPSAALADDPVPTNTPFPPARYAVGRAMGLHRLFLPGTPTYSAHLLRYPYLTDVVASYATINWATDRSSPTGYATWGKVGSEPCTAHPVSATKTNFYVNAVPEYQW